MPSGTHLTLEDRDHILRLAGLVNPDGSWALTKVDISLRVGVHPITVDRVLRVAAVKWGKEHAWTADSH